MFNITSAGTHATRKAPVDGTSMQVRFLTVSLTCLLERSSGQSLRVGSPNERGFYSDGGELLRGPKEIRCEHMLGNYKDYKD